MLGLFNSRGLMVIQLTWAHGGVFFVKMKDIKVKPHNMPLLSAFLPSCMLSRLSIESYILYCNRGPRSNPQKIDSTQAQCATFYETEQCGKKLFRW